MRLKTLLLFPAVMLLGLASVAYAGSVAPLGAPVPATFSAAGTDHSAAAITFGVNLFGVDGSAASIDFSKLWSGTGDTGDGKNHAVGLMQPVTRPSIGGAYGNLGGWGVYAQAMVSRHFSLVPGPGMVGLGILWPQILQWQK